MESDGKEELDHDSGACTIWLAGSVGLFPDTDGDISIVELSIGGVSTGMGISVLLLLGWALGQITNRCAFEKAAYSSLNNALCIHLINVSRAGDKDLYVLCAVVSAVAAALIDPDSAMH